MSPSQTSDPVLWSIDERAVARLLRAEARILQQVERGLPQPSFHRERDSQEVVRSSAAR